MSKPADAERDAERDAEWDAERDLVARAGHDLAAGGMVVLIDEAHGRCGLLVCAAATTTPEQMSFLVRNGTGYVCVAVPDDLADRLMLPELDPTGDLESRIRYTVSIDAAQNTTTGISAADRAATARVIGGDDPRPEELTRPGHLVPVRVEAAGTLRSRTAAAAAMDLCRLAHLRPAAVHTYLVSRTSQHELAGEAEARRFAAQHGLLAVSVVEVAAHRARTEPVVVRATSSTTTRSGVAVKLVDYVGMHDQRLHAVAMVGDATDPAADVPVTVYCNALAGAILSRVFCRCQERLERTLADFCMRGRGVLICLEAPAPSGAFGSAHAERITLDDSQSHIVRQILIDLEIAGADAIRPDVLEPCATHTKSEAAPATDVAALHLPARWVLQAALDR